MRFLLPLSTVFGVVLLSLSVAGANPSMIPKHPGYPMGKSVDPVRGQSLANDAGQSNAVGDKALAEASSAEDAHVKQELSINRQDKRILEKPGAGLLPKVEGPNITIEPPVKEATKVNAAPK
ncbi:hypothetical protein YTPLAS18_36960 [Nitrospira sp.]|nr:hypothetical protein YTPLAS18_36960 [Nitrospira sp.]